MKKRSLFSRYFSLCASIIMTSIVLLGLILVMLSARYFKDDNLDSLQRRAVQVADLVSYDYRRNSGKYIEYNVITSSFSIISATSEMDVFLTDTSGKVLICSDNDECVHKEAQVDDKIMKKTLAKGFRAVSNIGGIYAHNAYVVGVPVKVDNDITIGAVFVSTNASIIQSYIKDVFTIFIIGAFLIIVVSFVVIYFTTEAMARPLRAMLRATDSFAKGDFAVRVPVEGDEEIEQLAMAFNNMASNLANLENTRRSFVANVSHELKTPMTTIGGFIDGILDGTIPAEQYNYYLGIVSDEVKRLSRMVVSMLNISRIEAGEMKFNPQTVDINEIVCRTVLGFEKALEEKNIEVTGLDIEKNYALADPDFVHQIVYNLIENAVKFTPENGTLAVTYSKEDDKMLTVAIRNTGEGISKEEIPKLFDRFYKTDRSRSMDKKGVGLGLHIVKSLVHLQGGTITVRSAEGEYTEFVFTLPASSPKSNGSLFRKQDKQRQQ